MNNQTPSTTSSAFPELQPQAPGPMAMAPMAMAPMGMPSKSSRSLYDTASDYWKDDKNKVSRYGVIILLLAIALMAFGYYRNKQDYKDGMRPRSYWEYRYAPGSMMIRAGVLLLVVGVAVAFL